MNDPTLPPTRPSRAALAAVLARAAKGEPLLADRPVDPHEWCAQMVDLQNGWRLCVCWNSGAVMDRLIDAWAPDGAHWTYGCDRWPDWNAGPEAVVLDPLTHLLTPEQRERLRQRLLTCRCWPEPDPLPAPPPRSAEEIERLLTFDPEEMAS
jgi:hypothetical protein